MMKIPTQGWIPTLILFIHIIQLVSPFPVQGKLVRSYLPFMLLIMPCRCLLLGSQSREKKDERESLVSGSWFLVPDGLVHAVGCRCQGGIRTDLHILFFGLERSVLSLFTTKKFLVVKSRKWRINKTMSLRYREYIASISRVYREYIASISRVYREFIANVAPLVQMLRRHIRDILAISSRYTRDILAIYSRYTRDILAIYSRNWRSRDWRANLAIQS